jgi:type I restriction enzyme S subunit
LKDGEWAEKKLGDKEVSTFVNQKISIQKLNINSYISTENMLAEFSGVTSASKLPQTGSFTKFIEGDILILGFK